MIKTVRILSAALIVGAAAYIGAPLDANHTIDFDSHSCSPEPSPTAPGEPGEPGEPELSPPPTAEPTPPASEPTPPPQNCMPDENERIWGTRTIKFSTQASQLHELTRVALYIHSEEKGIPDANGGKPLLEQTFPSGAEVESYDKPFKWKSVEMTPRNGRYKIKVDVDETHEVTGETHRATMERKRLFVDNPPVALAAPKLIATTVETISLEWDPSTAPDVISYDVYRAKTSSREKKPAFADFKPIGLTAATTYRDPVPPGVYWYSVRVTRRSAVTPEKGISSPLSPMSWPGDTKSLLEKESEKKPEPPEPRLQPYRPLTSAPRLGSRLANAPDAPFAYKLPYDKDVGTLDEPMEAGTDDPSANDPRGPVLPVAVGMFLLSSALAVGRMPY